MKLEQIGWAVIKEPTTMVNNGFECAAWYEKILVEPGKYPLMAEIKGDEVDCVWTRYTGTVISDNFQTMFYGNPVGNYDTEKNAGMKTEYSPYMHGYMLAEKLAANDEGYELYEGFELMGRFFEHERFDGAKERRILWDIKRR